MSAVVVLSDESDSVFVLDLALLDKVLSDSEDSVSPSPSVGDSELSEVLSSVLLPVLVVGYGLV